MSPQRPSEASASGSSVQPIASQSSQPGPSTSGPIASTSASTSTSRRVANSSLAPFQTSSLSNTSYVPLDRDGNLLKNFVPDDEKHLYVENNFIRQRPLDIVHEFSVDEVTFYANLTAKNLCNIPNCTGHLIYGMIVRYNLPVEFLHHKMGNVAKYWPYVAKACLPYRTPRDREELIGGIRWNTLTPRKPHVKGISNSCMIDGWLTDIKLRSLDVKTCLGCWFIHKSGPGLKIEKTLRTISKFILTCSSPTPDASGQNQIVKDLTHDQDLFIKTIWLQEKFANFDPTIYYYRRGGQKFQNKLVDLLHPSAEPGESEVVTRMSMHK